MRSIFFAALLKLLSKLRERVLANYAILSLGWLPAPQLLRMQLWKTSSKAFFAVAGVALLLTLWRPAGFAEPA